MPIDYPSIPYAAIMEGATLPDFAQKYKEGIEARTMRETQPAVIEQAKQNAILAQQKSQMQAPMAADAKGSYQRSIQDELQKIALQKAQQMKAQQETKNIQDPSYGLTGTPLLGQRYQQAVTQFGEGDPRTQSLKQNILDAKQDQQSKVAAQQATARSTSLRNQPQIVKLQDSISTVQSGLDPISGTPLSSEDQSARLNQLKMQLYKETVPQPILTGLVKSENMERTIDNLDANAIAAYSGPGGAKDLIKDAKDSAAGRPSARFKAYEAAKVSALSLAEQVGNFWGGSRGEVAQAKIESLVNPATFFKDPSTVIAKYTALVKILRSEAKTYREAANSSSAYALNRADSQQTGPSQQPGPGSQSMSPSVGTGLPPYAQQMSQQIGGQDDASKRIQDRWRYVGDQLL